MRSMPDVPLVMCLEGRLLIRHKREIEPIEGTGGEESRFHYLTLRPKAEEPPGRCIPE
jgi:hypothetical protein